MLKIAELKRSFSSQRAISFFVYVQVAKTVIEIGSSFRPTLKAYRKVLKLLLFLFCYQHEAHENLHKTRLFRFTTSIRNFVTHPKRKLSINSLCKLIYNRQSSVHLYIDSPASKNERKTPKSSVCVWGEYKMGHKIDFNFFFFSSISYCTSRTKSELKINSAGL
jgi:hypothetical protein